MRKLDLSPRSAELLARAYDLAKRVYERAPTQCRWLSLLCTLFSALALGAGEKPYQFRERLECVHEANRRDAALKPSADEFEIKDGFAIALPADADAALFTAARDFEDYLWTSMGVAADVRRSRSKVEVDNGVTLLLDASLAARQSKIAVTDAGVAIRAQDARAAAQALYHLEDLMNLRRAPFLKKGTETRRAIFEVRMAHSGYGNDMFPEPHLAQMAHAGFTAILVFLDDIDKTKMQDYQDLQALIRRAKKYGLDTYLYSYITAFNHPDEGPAPFDASYGRIAGHYPEAKGIILVGESCQFPSKDPRVQPRTWKMGKTPGDTRPLAGWFPCRDYPDWLRAVRRAIHANAPQMELVFWTYNWGWAPEKDRFALIDALPTDVTVMATFEMFEMLTKRNGLTCPVADYSLAFAGPGKYFVSEATRAHQRGLTLATQAMAGGPTWDFGTVPYQPCPHQWLNRWRALVKANADWGLSRVMENHHNGWWPSFVNELEKEAFTEGGLPFDEHVRQIAARDFGAANAERAVAVWKDWSDRARDYVPTDINQYGPFRIGPAYPFTFGHPVVKPEEFPIARYACNGIGICRLNYLNTTFVTQNIREDNDPAYMAKEIELLEPMAKSFADGARAFAGMRGAPAARMANFAHYLAASVRTAINVKRGAIAFLKKDDAGILAAARDEYCNAASALSCVERDSRLGWEPTMEYAGGPEQIRWKMTRMERDYGEALFAAPEPDWISVAEPGPAAGRTTEYVKTFVNRAPVKRAVWTMTGLGVFDAYVNGRRVGTDILKPGYTHHAKTKFSYDYDVTPFLKNAKGATNVLAAVQSGGWWSDRCVWGFNGAEFKNAFRAELALTYEDGMEEKVRTNPSWRAAYAGPVVEASIWNGEIYDARIEPTWRTTGECPFPPAVRDDQFKGEVLPMVGPKVVLREDLVRRPAWMKVWRVAEGAGADRFGRIKVLRELKPTDFPVRLNNAEHLLVDFGQNAAYVPRLVASAPQGIKLIVTCAEMLNDNDGLKSRGNDGPEGSPYITNYRSSRVGNFTYVFAGKDWETATPRHTFFGYRYLQLRANNDVVFKSIESVPVTSIGPELERGKIVTGDARVNRLIRNCVWGMYSNYLSVPTDCPQRDERQGWAADTQVFALAASYAADVSGFFHKWMRDMRDTQDPKGGYSSVAPCGWVSGNHRRIGWADAGIIVPYVVWRQYGDKAIVDENWASMEKYMRLLEKSRYRTVVGSDEWGDGGFQFGDWLSYERWESWANWEYLSKHRDAEDYWNLLGACYWIWDARMMAEMAAGSGRGADKARYEAMAATALDYARAEFLAKDGLLLEKFRDMQTATLFALKVGLFASPEANATACELLRANFAAHGGCLQTGFLGTSILLDTVTENLGAKEAYDLLLQRKEPSWLFSVDNGATTMWERWNSYTKEKGFGKAGMNSFNHYAYGAVMGWMYRTMAGLAADPKGGWRHFTLAPRPDRRLGSVAAEYRSVSGPIRSAWSYDAAGVWTWTFTIPSGSEATVVVPGGKTQVYAAGTHTVTVPNL